MTDLSTPAKRMASVIHHIRCGDCAACQEYACDPPSAPLCRLANVIFHAKVISKKLLELEERNLKAIGSRGLTVRGHRMVIEAEEAVARWLKRKKKR